jgi:hypothetical protein
MREEVWRPEVEEAERTICGEAADVPADLNMVRGTAYGEVVPIATPPFVVAKYAVPDDVRAVVEAYVAVRAMPLYVRPEESWSIPPVPAYVTRPDVRPEMEMAVVEAYGKVEAPVDVAVNVGAVIVTYEVRAPVTRPDPWTVRVLLGEVVPIPTEPAVVPK